MPKAAYQRILLKLSGEALVGDQEYGISPAIVKKVSAEVKEIREMGVEVGIVIGGGNIYRGVAASAEGMDRTSADHMGMLATVINSLSLQDALEKAGRLHPGSLRRSRCTKSPSLTSGGGRCAI